MKKKVAVIMGSQTDLRVMTAATDILEEFKVPYHMEVVSAHRTPGKMKTFAEQARDNGFQVIIAGAGGAAHLPGMVASFTTLPVIGVPVEVGKLKGLDSILSILQMPRGVPVATVALENAYNAGLLAVQILSLGDAKVAKKLDQFKENQRQKVQLQNKNLRKKRKAR